MVREVQPLRLPIACYRDGLPAKSSTADKCLAHESPARASIKDGADFISKRAVVECPRKVSDKFWWRTADQAEALSTVARRPRKSLHQHYNLT